MIVLFLLAVVIIIALGVFSIGGAAVLIVFGDLIFAIAVIVLIVKLIRKCMRK